VEWKGSIRGESAKEKNGGKKTTKGRNVEAALFLISLLAGGRRD